LALEVGRATPNFHFPVSIFQFSEAFVSEEHRLTKIECQKFLIGFLPPLIDLAESVDTVRAAVYWLVSDDPAAEQTWALLRDSYKQITKAREAATQSIIQTIPPRGTD
jgi:hypothetical protein